MTASLPLLRFSFCLFYISNFSSLPFYWTWLQSFPGLFTNCLNDSCWSNFNDATLADKDCPLNIKPNMLFLLILMVLNSWRLLIVIPCGLIHTISATMLFYMEWKWHQELTLYQLLIWQKHLILGSFVPLTMFLHLALYLLSCPGQLNRWPCHLLISATSEHYRAVVDRAA